MHEDQKHTVGFLHMWTQIFTVKKQIPAVVGELSVEVIFFTTVNSAVELCHCN